MTTTEGLAPDREALRQRYLAERDKRLRPDGPDQYIEMTGEYGHFIEDPYVEPEPREPLTDEVTVALVGGGFAGLITAARLVQAGITDVRIIEKGGDFGGTWYWNRYPGAQCDVESYIYLPLLEETGYVPKEKYSHAPEIQEHCRRLGEHFGLYDNACLGTEVTAAEWDDAASRWTIRTNRGDAMRAQYLVIGGGPLHRPKLPGIPGIEDFAGHSFHTSRWDYDYTGGDTMGGLEGLRDKRVGIIGTGATAVQVVPHLAEACQQLYVFQRTPSSIDVRANRPTDPEWAASLPPGWQAERIANFTALTGGGFAAEDLVMDGWTDIIGRIVALLRDRGEMSAGSIAAALEESDFQKMDDIRARVDQIVEDPDTAAALKPWYKLFCKRPCFHDAYLQSYNRPNVTLVDTDGKGVDRITATSVVVGDREHEVDCLIYATGFEVSTAYTQKLGFDPVGRGGRTLSEHWAKGMRTMHGMHVHGFPSLFIIGHAQGAFTANYPHLIEECAKQIQYILTEARDRGADVVEVTAEAEEAWVREIEDNPPRFAGFGNTSDCTPGYYNNEGRMVPGFTGFFYSKGALGFFALIEEWRRAGHLEGLELREV
jgi:cation diffusion facilitator CzcD-associated flavoprotein CzcO